MGRGRRTRIRVPLERPVRLVPHRRRPRPLNVREIRQNSKGPPVYKEKALAQIRYRLRE